MAKISQREARLLQKRVAELESREFQRRHQWTSDWPGGVNFWNLTVSAEAAAAIKTACALGHYIVVRPSSSSGYDVRLYAMPVPK